MKLINLHNLMLRAAIGGIGALAVLPGPSFVLAQSSPIPGRPALVAAADKGHLSEVLALLKKTTPRKELGAALGAATYNNHADVVKALLKAGADANSQDFMPGFPVVSEAANMGAIDVLQLLLNAGANPNVPDSANKKTAIFWATHSHNANILRALLRAGADARARDAAGATPLIEAVDWGGSPDMVGILIKAGADLNAEAKNHVTAWRQALAKGSGDIITALIAAGANPKGDDKGKDGPFDPRKFQFNGYDGRAPLMTCALMGRGECVNALLQAGVDANQKHWDGGTKGFTALMMAAQSGGMDVIEALLKGGADPNLMNERGNTALMSAAFGGHIGVIKALFHAGAKLDVQNEMGASSLMLAVIGGHDDAVQALLQAGARVDLKNSKGQTAEVLANKYLDPAILAALKAANH